MNGADQTPRPQTSALFLSQLLNGPAAPLAVVLSCPQSQPTAQDGIASSSKSANVPGSPRSTHAVEPRASAVAMNLIEFPSVASPHARRTRDRLMAESSAAAAGALRATAAVRERKVFRAGLTAGAQATTGASRVTPAPDTWDLPPAA